MITATTSTDAYMSALNDGTYDYVIQKDNTTIFRGRVFSPDSQHLALIDINKVAKDYLEVSVPVLTATTVTQHPDAFATFNCGRGFEIEQFFIRQDYSGEPWTGADKELSEPINGHVDPRQKILYSAFNNSTATKNIIPQ